MRLVCPNCSAQYEIDGSMIPDEGRDVQCSNCGHTWFELPAPAADFAESPPEILDEALDTGQEEVAADEEFAEAEEADAFDEDAEAASEREISEIVEAYVDPDDDIEIETPEPVEDESPSDTIAAAAMAALLDKSEAKAAGDDPTAKKPRRAADVAALEILREEAEREMTQRHGEAGTLETQADLGLDALYDGGDEPSRAMKARRAHLGEDESDAASEDAGNVQAVSRRPTSVHQREAYAEPRRDLLPDIDEINSTLKPTPVQEAPSKSGFVTGFVLMLVIAFVLIFGYWQAPSIVQLFPESESVVISYVDQANAFRDWLQGLISGS